jgi:hypothetical protein
MVAQILVVKIFLVSYGNGRFTDLRKINNVRISIAYHFQIHFNIIVLHKSRSSK